MHVDPLEPFDFVEIFSGRQAVTRVMYGTQSTCQSGASPFHRYSEPSVFFMHRHQAGYRCASYDRDIGGDSMDFCKPAGYLRLS